MTIIECENVRKMYHQSTQEITALDGISLTVEKGEFLALAGPSGSGKTTLLNIVGGLDHADEGRVALDGTVLNGMSASLLADLRLRKVGFVFQAYNLIPVLSALENVEFVMLLQGVPASERLERARAILDEVGLAGHARTTAGRTLRRPAAAGRGRQGHCGKPVHRSGRRADGEPRFQDRRPAACDNERDESAAENHLYFLHPRPYGHGLRRPPGAAKGW